MYATINVKKSKKNNKNLLTSGSFEGLGSRECALTYKTKHKTFRTYEKKRNKSPIENL
jgi:hypothetical protein